MKSLALKLLAVQREVTSVEKDGHNDFQNYDYATEAGFLRMLRPLLTANGLVILSNVRHSEIVATLKDKSGRDVPLTRVQMEFTIIDSESGESFTGGAEGYGADNLDKGIYKAQTGATKYFLAKCFMIPTGDDPENEAAEKPVRKAATKPVSTAPAPFPSNVPNNHGACLACNMGLMVERDTAKGKVLACSNYPKCRNVMPL